MEIIENTLTVAWHLRWVIVATAFAGLGAAYADSLADRRRLRRRIAQLEEGHRRLIVRLNERRAQRRRQPIIAGRVIGQ
jgi:hypothetical protein